MTVCFLAAAYQAEHTETGLTEIDQTGAGAFALRQRSDLAETALLGDAFCTV